MSDLLPASGRYGCFSRFGARFLYYLKRGGNGSQVSVLWL